MLKIITLENTNIHLVAPEAELSFLDSQSVELSKPITPLEAWKTIIGNSPKILKHAFKIRDAISTKFGVKAIGGFTENFPKTVMVGDKLDFFLVEYISENTLSLTERDTHLDTMSCITIANNTLTITSSVKTHNLFGKIYMLPVAPAHKLIVRNMLKNFHL